MVRVVPMARAMFDRCGVVLGGGATLRRRLCVWGAGLRGVLMIRCVVLSGRWFRGGRARSRFCVGWRFEPVHVAVYDERRPGSIPVIGQFKMATGVFVRSRQSVNVYNPRSLINSEVAEDPSAPINHSRLPAVAINIECQPLARWEPAAISSIRSAPPRQAHIAHSRSPFSSGSSAAANSRGRAR
jgi:hypothetical protein